MAVTAFNHYNLRATRDMLDQLLDFYTAVVGLRRGERPPFTSFGYWLYIGEQAVLHLSEARAGESRAANVPTTFDHVAFSCEGWDETLALLQRHQLSYRTAQVPETQLRQIFFRDPAGNGVEFNFSEH